MQILSEILFQEIFMHEAFRYGVGAACLVYLVLKLIISIMRRRGNPITSDIESGEPDKFERPEK